MRGCESKCSVERTKTLKQHLDTVKDFFAVQQRRMMWKTTELQNKDVWENKNTNIHSWEKKHVIIIHKKIVV